MNVVDEWYLGRVEQSEESLETYRTLLSDPTPLQKGQYAGLLRLRSTGGQSSGFMDFMNR